MAATTLRVGSEVGVLREVILHRPGVELDRVTPANHDELLFDDVVWAARAAQEHDAFAETLRVRGVVVHRFAQLLAEALDVPGSCEFLLAQLATGQYVGPAPQASLTELLAAAEAGRLASYLIGGILERDIADVGGGPSPGHGEPVQLGKPFTDLLYGVFTVTPAGPVADGVQGEIDGGAWHQVRSLPGASDEDVWSPSGATFAESGAAVDFVSTATGSTLKPRLPSDLRKWIGFESETDVLGVVGADNDHASLVRCDVDTGACATVRALPSNWHSWQWATNGPATSGSPGGTRVVPAHEEVTPDGSKVLTQSKGASYVTDVAGGRKVRLDLPDDGHGPAGFESDDSVLLEVGKTEYGPLERCDTSSGSCVQLLASAHGSSFAIPPGPGGPPSPT